MSADALEQPDEERLRSSSARASLAMLISSLDKLFEDSENDIEDSSECSDDSFASSDSGCASIIPTIGSVLPDDSQKQKSVRELARIFDRDDTCDSSSSSTLAASSVATLRQTTSPVVCDMHEFHTVQRLNDQEFRRRRKSDALRLQQNACAAASAQAHEQAVEHAMSLQAPDSSPAAVVSPCAALSRDIDSGMVELKQAHVHAMNVVTPISSPAGADANTAKGDMMNSSTPLPCSSDDDDLSSETWPGDSSAESATPPSEVRAEACAESATHPSDIDKDCTTSRTRAFYYVMLLATLASCAGFYVLFTSATAPPVDDTKALVPFCVDDIAGRQPHGPYLHVVTASVPWPIG